MAHDQELRLRDEPASDAPEASAAVNGLNPPAAAEPTGVREGTACDLSDLAQAARRVTPKGTAKGPVMHGEAPAPHPARFPWVRSVLVPAVVALGCGMGGAYLYVNDFAGRQRPAAAASAKATTEAVPADEIRALMARADQSSERLNELEARIEALPKSGPAPNVAELQVKVAELCKSMEEVAPLAQEEQQMDARVEELFTSVRALREELRGLEAQVEKKIVPVSVPRPPFLSSFSDPATEARALGRANPMPAASAPGAAPRAASHHDAAKPAASAAGSLVPDRDLARGVELLRRGKYRDALDYFSKLELTHLDDARVWYFAALSQGFATNDWDHDAVSLVEKGVERERAGTPDSATIDAAFQDLTSATGKDWLATYRKRVAAP